MKKKLLALILAGVMVLSLVACGAPAADPTEAPAAPTDAPAAPTDAPASTDPLDMITEGYYQHTFSAEGHGEFGFFFHFYEEVPVLGSVFYAGLNNNRSTFVGTYTVEEVPFDYACFPDRATKTDPNATPTEGTAPYTVTFFDWDGNELGKVGFDGDILYNTMDEGSVIYASGSGTINYLHDTTGEKASLYEGELGVPYLEYVADEEKTSTLAINHNGTYTDLVNAMIEGNWTVADNAEGGLDFTFTPFDSLDTGAVVSTNADKTKCTYTPDGGEAIAMSTLSNKGPVVAYAFEGTYNIAAYNMDAAVLLNAYDDGTCDVTMNVAGNVREMAKGTYVLDGYTFVFNFEGVDEIKSAVDGSGVITVDLALSGTAVGDVQTVLTRVEVESAEPKVAHTFTGKHTIAAYNMEADVVLTAYDDGSCTVTASVAGNEQELAKGTYVLDGHTFIFSLEGAEEMKSSVDGTGTITVQLVLAGTAAGDIDTVMTRVAE